MAKSKKALKALKRKKEAQKRSRVVKERQDYTAGGRVKAFTGINIGQDQIEAATKAAEEYQKIIRLQPKDPRIYGKLVQLYIDNQIHLDIAISLAQTAIRLAPNSSIYLNQLAWIYYNTGRYTEAEENLLKALKIDPNNQLYLEGLEEIRKILSQ